MSAICVACDLHTIAPRPLEHACWRQFAVQWGVCKKSWIVPFSLIIIISPDPDWFTSLSDILIKHKLPSFVRRYAAINLVTEGRMVCKSSLFSFIFPIPCVPKISSLAMLMLPAFAWNLPPKSKCPLFCVLLHPEACCGILFDCLPLHHLSGHSTELSAHCTFWCGVTCEGPCCFLWKHHT